MNRRQFMAMLAAGAVVTAEGLWMPGEKLISIPEKKIFVPKLKWHRVEKVVGDMVYSCMTTDPGLQIIADRGGVRFQCHRESKITNMEAVSGIATLDDSFRQEVGIVT